MKRQCSAIDTPTAAVVFLDVANTEMSLLDTVARHLIDVCICWFNYHQPDQGRIWVPHPAWAHTVLALPTQPQPAPNPGGQTRAAPQLSANALNIPPYNGLAYWGSRTGRQWERNLRTMMKRYAQTVGPGAHAEPLE